MRVSSQRLVKQRQVKRALNNIPIVKMKKADVDKEQLISFVVMPDGIVDPLKQWWKRVPEDFEVDVRYPHGKHGLVGKVSNNAKIELKKDFLSFVDENSQPNGRRTDSRNPTHYLLPKFTMITLPKESDTKYREKMLTSLTGEFNRVQAELGKGTISDFSARKWLREERPKLALFPHKVDYCDTCASFRIQLHSSKQQVINRMKQAGEGIEQQQAEKEKDTFDSQWSEHK